MALQDTDVQRSSAIQSRIGCGREKISVRVSFQAALFHSQKRNARRRSCPSQNGLNAPLTSLPRHPSPASLVARSSTQLRVKKERERERNVIAFALLGVNQHHRKPEHQENNTGNGTPTKRKNRKNLKACSSSESPRAPHPPQISAPEVRARSSPTPSASCSGTPVLACQPRA